MKLTSTGLPGGGNRRLGRARRQIVELFSSANGPITAEFIIDRLHGVHPSSVYRSLNVLEDLGIVRHVHLSHGAALYELTGSQAAVRHLVCETCGKSHEIPDALLDPLRRRVTRDYDFVLDAGHFALTGHCSDCVPQKR